MGKFFLIIIAISVAILLAMSAYVIRRLHFPESHVQSRRPEPSVSKPHFDEARAARGYRGRSHHCRRERSETPRSRLLSKAAKKTGSSALWGEDCAEA
jgi:hypothetical protein